jgi:protein TonB
VRAAAALAAILVLCATPAAAQEDPAVGAPRPAYTDAVPEGPGVDERLAEIGRRIQSAAAYPAIARERGVEGQALVAFEIGADGRARDVETRETSGSIALDRAAERAVVDAGRFPYVYGRITVPVRFALR